MQTLSVGDCIRFGWETFKQRPWILIGGFALAIFISAIPSIFTPTPDITPGEPPPAPSAFAMLMGLVSLVVGIFVSLGIATFSLRAHDDVARVEIGDLWNPAPFWRYLGAEILMAIAIVIGFLLLIVPGVIVALGLAFVPYLVVDRGAGPIEALKESWRITKGHKWRLFLLVLALIGINIIGLLLLVVGILVSMPVSALATVHAYRTLGGPRPA